MRLKDTTLRANIDKFGWTGRVSLHAEAIPFAAPMPLALPNEKRGILVKNGDRTLGLSLNPGVFLDRDIHGSLSSRIIICFVPHVG